MSALQSARGVTREQRLLEAALALGVFGWAMVFFQLKLNGLLFHTRDFPYYANKYICLVGNTCDGLVNLNPIGRNFLGFRGVDGFPLITNDIHLSPVVWLISGLYHVSQSLLVIQTIWAAAAAVLAIVIFRTLSLKFSSTAAILLTVLLLVIPSFSHWATDDLTVLPLFGLAVAFVCYGLLTKSPLMVVVACLAMALVREEAIIMSAIAAAWLTVMQHRLARVLVLWSAALFVLAVAYFSTQEFALAGWMRIAVSAVAIGAVGLLTFRRSLLPESVYDWALRWRFVLVPLSFALPYSLELKRVLLPPNAERLFEWLFLEPQFFVFNALVLMALAFGVFAGDISKLRRAVGICIGAVFFVSMAAAFVVTNGPAFTTKPHYLHDIAGALKQRNARVLTDYAAYQAFLGYDKAFVFLRLPAYKFPEDPRNRYFPKNIQQLEKEIRDWADVIVSEREHYARIGDLVTKHWGHADHIECGRTVVVTRTSREMGVHLSEICGANARTRNGRSAASMRGNAAPASYAGRFIAQELQIDLLRRRINDNAKAYRIEHRRPADNKQKQF